MVEPIFIERRKLFEQVAAHIEREILEGKLKPGDRLPPERGLQLKFGVGRPAIREALITLQRAGLVEIGNGSPARVSMPTMNAVMAGLVSPVQQMLSSAEGQRQLQGARLFMEVGLVRHAAENATEDDLARLGEALENNRLTLGDREGFIQTDVAFHFVFAEIIRNATFVALHHAMSTWLLHQRQIALLEPGEDQKGYDAHARIYQAVVSRDPDAAETAMRHHLEWGWVAFWRRYADSGQLSS
jgi:GntR family transcriptional repressor for pyruvate dehydrogenase complex